MGVFNFVPSELYQKYDSEVAVALPTVLYFETQSRGFIPTVFKNKAVCFIVDEASSEPNIFRHLLGGAVASEFL